MAKYNWLELKRDYLTGDYKSLREFAEIKGIPHNGYFKKSTVGWSNEKRLLIDRKETEIVEKVTNQQIQYAIDRNAAHMATGDLIMLQLNRAIQTMKQSGKIFYDLQAAAATLEKIQKIQNNGEDNSIESMVKIIDDL